MKKVGFVGLGVMGAPMAKNIAAKYGPVVAFDVDADKVKNVISDRIEAAGSVAEVGNQVDVAVLSLPNSHVVKQVALGDDGLASVMPAGSVIIDTSTTEPTVSIEIAEKLKPIGIDFLDAPVSGGEKAASGGTLSFMVGGDEAVFEANKELLGSMGTTVVRLGGSGMGETAKMVNQMIVGATFAIVAEGYALAVKAGLDPAALYEAIRNGWAGSNVMDLAVPAMLERNFKPGGTVNIHAKDLGYALSLAKDIDVPTPVTALVHEIFKAAKAGGKGQLAQPAIVELWESLLAVQVVPN